MCNISGNVSGLMESITCNGLNSVEVLAILDVDVSSVPFNIINSLAKIVKGRILLQYVTGFYSSMLENVNCEKLKLIDMNLPEQMTQVQSE